MVLIDTKQRPSCPSKATAETYTAIEAIAGGPRTHAHDRKAWRRDLFEPSAQSVRLCRRPNRSCLRASPNGGPHEARHQDNVRVRRRPPPVGRPCGTAGRSGIKTQKNFPMKRKTKTTPARGAVQPPVGRP